ncbi:MAG TPA: dihydrolipoyl dehydrogenase [Feifaniaceae bacterium]|nr:dihydrolipoyl dehydrogenase [Feifaniaceae bacterium]
MTYDIGVIGGGPGGYVAAIKAAQLGAKVILFERDSLGGTCLNRGCVPTKALLKSAELFRQVKEAAAYGIAVGGCNVDFPGVMRRKDGIVRQLTGGVAGLLKKNGVTVVMQEAALLNKNAIRAGGETYGVKNVILAMGSKPAKPPIRGIEHAKNSDDVLKMERLPASVAIIGGGVIGVEFASVLAALGTKVTIVELLPTVLNMADDAVIEAAERLLKKQGVEIVTGAKVREILPDGLLYEGDAGIVKAAAEMTVVATGRVPDTDAGELDRLGIAHDRGRIVTDARMRTSVPGIYAIGDLNGVSMLAHTASREGVVAVKNILGQNCLMSYDFIPSCVYTAPEIAWIGMSEKDAKKMGVRYKTGVFPLAGNSKSLIEGEADGFIKLIADASTDELIGGHMVCGHATDMVAELGVLMHLEGTAEDIAETVHPHPTVSESVMEAAEALLGKAIHF